MRSQAAYDARAELVLNRKKRDARVETHVRTPGLAYNRYRMGDVRFWSHRAGAKLSGAALHDGARSLALEVEDTSFKLPIGDASWSNDAIVELEFAPGAARTAPAAREAAP